jgi:hypothetical protein
LIEVRLIETQIRFGQDGVFPREVDLDGRIKARIHDSALNAKVNLSVLPVFARVVNAIEANEKKLLLGIVHGYTVIRQTVNLVCH